jgi:hypothetical protein
MFMTGTRKDMKNRQLSNGLLPARGNEALPQFKLIMINSCIQTNYFD